ncbi:MAG: hypothetical protein QF752_00050 [Planctomycetota bacterium]|jgi:hypothetical protein|nr:hypothetical protein [Planctomycetota bacterium]
MARKERGELFEVLGRRQDTSSRENVPVSARSAGFSGSEPVEFRIALPQVVLLGAFVLFGFILVFFAGKKFGSSDSRTEAVATLKRPTANTPRQTRGDWTLRLVSLPNREPGERVKEYLTHVHQIPAEEIQIRRAGSSWVVEVFRIADRRDAQALAVLSRFRELEYQGRKQFQSSYFARAVD